MDETTSTTDETRPGLNRRTFFSRSLLAAGAVVALTGLTGCPGGQGDDDGDDGDDDGGDDDDD